MIFFGGGGDLFCVFFWGGNFFWGGDFFIVQYGTVQYSTQYSKVHMERSSLHPKVGGVKEEEEEEEEEKKLSI